MPSVAPTVPGMSLNALAKEVGLTWLEVRAVVYQAGIRPREKTRGLIIPPDDIDRARAACLGYLDLLRSGTFAG